MTSYQGGKKRIGKQIHDFIIEFETKFGKQKTNYLEPFVGMCGVLIHFAKDNNRKIKACDINKDIILMWKEVQKGWIPPDTCSEKLYNELKLNKSSALRGFIGSSCSYAGSFFSGYRGKYDNRNFCKIGKNNVINFKNYLEDVKFVNSKSYEKFHPKNTLVYCDPPYKNNNIPNILFRNFDHDKFWEIMRNWSDPKLKNIVIISERIAPDDFISIWNKKTNVVFLNKKTNNNDCSEQSEHLFIHKSIYSFLN